MPAERFDIASLMPDSTPGYMLGAWVAFIHFALGEPEIVADFRRDTGNNWQPGKTAIERQIDQATGADRAFLTAFVAWVNENHWGVIDAC